MSRHPRQPEDTDGEAGFLTRWSRRKDQAKSKPSPQPEEKAQPEADNRNDKEPVKGDEDMPPVESIDENSDVSDFFSPGVSESLRKAALKKFFHSPAFNIVDGLDDYDDDFTTFQALGDIVTADMRHQMEVEKERAKEREQGKAEAQLPEELQEESSDSIADDGQDETVRPNEAEGEHDDLTRSDVNGGVDDSDDTEGEEKSTG